MPSRLGATLPYLARSGGFLIGGFFRAFPRRVFVVPCLGLPGERGIFAARAIAARVFGVMLVLVLRNNETLGRPISRTRLAHVVTSLLRCGVRVDE